MRDEVKTYAWKNVGEVFVKKIKNESNSTKQSKDSETLFGEMVAQELLTILLVERGLSFVIKSKM